MFAPVEPTTIVSFVIVYVAATGTYTFADENESVVIVASLYVIAPSRTLYVKFLPSATSQGISNVTEKTLSQSAAFPAAPVAVIASVPSSAS